MIYTASSQEHGRSKLDAFAAKWDTKCPHISKSWNENWAELSTFYKYSEEIRKLIYTTNPIESFNRGIRKATKTRSVFPSEDAVFKLLFLVTETIEKKWTNAIRDWGMIYSQLMIFFEDKLNNTA